MATIKPTTIPQLANVMRPGDNHTGIQLNPQSAIDMVEGTREFGPTSSGGADLLAEARIRMAKLVDPVATMPPTPELPVERLPLLDKLGARLQFERMGVRLYDALISKLDAYGTFPGGPRREDLAQIRDEEHAHLALCQTLIMQVGGDPTVVTPCANLQAVASKGIGDILVDPRTTLIECLDAVLIAELADHESWEQLVTAVAMLGDKGIEGKVRDALHHEVEHLVKVRGWIAGAQKLLTKPVD